MDGSITLPAWQFYALAALAIVCLLDRLMVPGVRWFLRQRALRVLEECPPCPPCETSRSCSA